MTNPHNLPLPEKFLKLTENIRRIDDKGLFYSLDYTENYYELEQFANKLAGAGCSTFITRSFDGEYIMGRNYDFSHFRYNQKKDPNALTGLAIFIDGHNPAAKYKSIGVADGFWLDQVHGSYFEGTLDDGKTDISALALAPFLCMDGVNEKGLAVSIMQLDKKNYWEEVDYVDPDSLSEEEKDDIILLEKGEEPRIKDYKAKEGTLWINAEDHKTWKNHKEATVDQKEPGKKNVFHPVLMRMMLDYCATVDEAVAMAYSVNMKTASPGNDFHVMVADRSGKSVIIEWTNNITAVGEIDHATNYELLSADKFGHAQHRDNILVNVLDFHRYGMNKEMVLDTLKVVSQDRRIDSHHGFTQWSSIYNLEKNSLSLYMQMDYDKEYTFEVK